MVRKKNYTDKDKISINNRHVDIFNKSLDAIELILNGFLKDLKKYNQSFLDLPKPIITALDFIISSLTKIQKGQRLALGLDNDLPSDEKEPEVNVIKGVDLEKI
ncbi:MAG: hypothetical protein J6O88_11775 [Chryseobacterium sp.]|uniref:hypothetical protein n=1 Tax=Chryseobacterium sp. TaxID=1871047 RepID=UPI001B04E4E9|nr:hypothetical protein [Chryseobacterium sp.]MBO6185346.1 hypothetical protein [Chryseobacterium sp.]